jgi:hypothetical protein
VATTTRGVHVWAGRKGRRPQPRGSSGGDHRHRIGGMAGEISVARGTTRRKPIRLHGPPENGRRKKIQLCRTGSNLIEADHRGNGMVDLTTVSCLPKNIKDYRTVTPCVNHNANRVLNLLIMDLSSLLSLIKFV